MAGALRTSLIIAVPEARAAVDAWRERTCRDRTSIGVPPHVTLLFPFAPASEIDAGVVDVLRSLVAAEPAFTFSLARFGRFPDVLYLTVAQGDAGVLDEAEAAVGPRLPIAGRGREVGLYQEVVPDWGRWELCARLPLGDGGSARP